MEAWLENLIAHSPLIALMAIGVLVFLESLAVVGFLFPGTVMMATAGAFIGNGDVSFYPAWLVGIIGCLLGDWTSYFIGRVFKTPLHRWSFLQRYQTLLRRTEVALQQHSMLTVLLGRFIGFTRPLVPMAAGMLNLSPARFLLPSLVGAITWPPVYFFPGILAGVAIGIPSGTHSTAFKILLVATVLTLWLALWLCWRWWRLRHTETPPVSRWLRAPYLPWLSLIACAATAILLWQLLHHPLMPVYAHLLWHVLHHSA